MDKFSTAAKKVSGASSPESEGRRVTMIGTMRCSRGERGVSRDWRRKKTRLD